MHDCLTRKTNEIFTTRFVYYKNAIVIFASPEKKKNLVLLCASMLWPKEKRTWYNVQII